MRKQLIDISIKTKLDFYLKLLKLNVIEKENEQYKFLHYNSKWKNINRILIIEIKILIHETIIITVNLNSRADTEIARIIILCILRLEKCNGNIVRDGSYTRVI